jgi:tetratricopeptide (TPR) repeat protein
MPYDRELDELRVGEALRRAWISQAQVELCLQEIGPEGSLLEALERRGVLTADQARELAAIGRVTVPESHPPTLRVPGPGTGPVDAEHREEVFATGDLINQRYRIQKLMGGGFGRVYICTDAVSGNRCALKTLLREHLGSARTLEMFRNEILLWIGLGDHPNIVLAYGLEEALRLPFVVMEAVDGGSLADRIAEGPLGWQAAAGFGWQIANGLEYVGQVCGLVHRDLKPANVLVTREGVAKVTDFGISLVRGRRDQAATGTPHYMPPEQWTRPADVDVRSDVYAFGVTLYELATGQLPFASPPGATPEEICQIHLTQTAPDPRQLEPRMPEAMARLIVRCLEKRQKDRPENFVTIRRTLEPFAGTQRQAPSFAPSRIGGLVNQSATYHQLGRQEDAERTARNAVQLDAKSIKARIALANALAARRAYPQALGHLEEAYRLAPAEPAPIVNSALYANLSGDLNRAQRWLQIAIDTLPTRELESLTWMMIELGRIGQVIEICEKIVGEDPTAILAWNSLSIAHRRSGQLEQALACADRTVQLNPRYAKGWSNRATILVQLGKRQEAVNSADRALQFEPATAGAYAAKAAALGQLGRASEARDCVLAGLALLPGNALLERALRQFEQLV